MLYKNKNKIFVRVSERFVEVTIKKDENGYTVTPTKNKIEAYGKEQEFKPISIDKAYEELNKSKFSSSSKLLSDLDNIE